MTCFFQCWLQRMLVHVQKECMLDFDVEYSGRISCMLVEEDVFVTVFPLPRSIPLRMPEFSQTSKDLRDEDIKHAEQESGIKELLLPLLRHGEHISTLSRLNAAIIAGALTLASKHMRKVLASLACLLSQSSARSHKGSKVPELWDSILRHVLRSGDHSVIGSTLEDELGDNDDATSAVRMLCKGASGAPAGALDLAVQAAGATKHGSVAHEASVLAVITGAIAEASGRNGSPSSALKRCIENVLAADPSGMQPSVGRLSAEKKFVLLLQRIARPRLPMLLTQVRLWKCLLAVCTTTVPAP
jgi:hypothetical protein